MEVKEWKKIALAPLVSIVYFFVYLELWDVSFDQWFLPVGLRVATLLFMPYRFWPFLYIGDAAALLYVRIPKAEKYSFQWAYFSPLLILPSIALWVAVIRRTINKIEDLVKWLPLITIGLTAWAALTTFVLNTTLSGPKFGNEPIYFFVRFSVGHQLGMMFFLVPCVVWMQRKSRNFPRKNFFFDLILSTTTTLALFLAIELAVEIHSGIKLFILMMMIIPAAWLTLRHGWRGAALGLLSTNFLIAQTLAGKNVPGTYDGDVLVVQIALIIVSTVVLLFENKMSALYERIRQYGIAERQAAEITKSTLFIAEKNLREQVLYMAQMQVYMDEQRKQVVELLRSQGKFSEALALNNKAVEHMQSFEKRSTAIYPIKIEEVGLYGVIFPQSFTDFWAGGAEVLFMQAAGKPRTLSVDLQLTAYRCICNAFTLLAQGCPERYVVKMKTGTRGNRQGIMVNISSHENIPHEITRSGALAEVDLTRRVKAFGGAWGHRNLYTIRILLWELKGTDETLTCSTEIMLADKINR